MAVGLLTQKKKKFVGHREPFGFLYFINSQPILNFSSTKKAYKIPNFTFIIDTEIYNQKYGGGGTDLALYLLSRY